MLYLAASSLETRKYDKEERNLKSPRLAFLMVHHSFLRIASERFSKSVWLSQTIWPRKANICVNFRSKSSLNLQVLNGPICGPIWGRLKAELLAEKLASQIGGLHLGPKLFWQTFLRFYVCKRTLTGEMYVVGPVHQHKFIRKKTFIDGCFAIKLVRHCPTLWLRGVAGRESPGNAL